ncbi:MAG: hypothetical protein ACI4ET_12405 [Bilifractor sp.]|nr:hypothetical protein [Eubacterium sp.]
MDFENVGRQIFVFRDIRTTGFYILQDLAFVPISFAITTVVVGAIMDQHEKRDSERKTRMLTSSFFIGLGAELMSTLLSVSETQIDPKKMAADSEADLSTMREQIEQEKIRVCVDEKSYTKMYDMILGSQTEIIILASNPMLLDQEYFAQLLWGVMHLTDEFHLRGEWSNLSQKDIVHFNDDFERVLRLLLINGMSNGLFLKNAFPEFWGTAVSRLER